MKNMYLIIVLVLTMSFLILPLLATEKSEKDTSKASSENGTSNLEEKGDTSNLRLENLSEIKLYLCEEEKTVTLKKNEYVLGVVAAEMSIENNIEALKAQALAAYTYAYRKHLQNSESGDYDLTNDPTLDQASLDDAGRKAKWGDKFEENQNKLKSAVDAVINQLIVHNSQPILAAYHAISAGKTETAKNVWGTDYPYLQSENSVADLLCGEFYSEVTVAKEEFLTKLTEIGATNAKEAEKIIGESKKSDSGTVLNITLCGKSFTGAQIREAFELRSAAFDLVLKENNLIFTVSGYGHGVGMSQFGANYMAQQGSDYKEIISAYYRGVQIVDVN